MIAAKQLAADVHGVHADAVYSVVQKSLFHLFIYIIYSRRCRAGGRQMASNEN